MFSSTSLTASLIPAFGCDARRRARLSQTALTLAQNAPSETLTGTLDTTRAARSLWSNAWRQFRRNKLAMVGMIYLIFLAVVAISAPLIAPHNPVQSDLRTAGKYRQ